MKTRKVPEVRAMRRRLAGFNEAAPVKTRKVHRFTQRNERMVELQRGRAGEDAEGIPAGAAQYSLVMGFNEAAPVKTRKERGLRDDPVLGVEASTRPRR